jgi:hypothetical protein
MDFGHQSMKVNHIFNPLALKETPIFSDIRENISPNELAEIYHIDIRTQPVILNINGEWIDRSFWDEPIPADAYVYFVALPRGNGGGGGSRNVLAVLATIVVLVASYYVGPWVSAALKPIWGAAAIGALAQAVVAVGGMLLVNQFFGIAPVAPESMTSDDGSVTNHYSLASGRNVITIGAPFPEHMGRFKVYPNLIMSSYTYFRNNEQYLKMLGVIGVGEYEVEDVFIDKTPFAEYGVDNEYVIYPPGSRPTLAYGWVPWLVWVSGETLGQELSTDWKAFVIEPRGVKSYSLEIDFVFQSGLIASNKNGDVYPQTVQIKAEYRLVDDNGDPLTDWAHALIRTYSEQTRETLRYSESITFGTSNYGRHEIRIKRLTEPSTDLYTVDAVTLQAVKAFGSAHPDYGDVTLFEARMKATDQLSGDAASKINLIATRKLRRLESYGLSEWKYPTRNPIDIACYIVTSENGGKNPESILDVESLYELRQLAETNGTTFDHRYTSRVSVMEACAMVGRLLRAVPVMPGGLFTFVRDEYQSTPTQIYTDDDITKGSLSLVHTYRTADSSTCVEAEYIDPVTFESESVFCYDQYGSLDNPATIQITGCTSRQLAYELGMYMYWDDRLGRSNVTFTTGLKGHIPMIGQRVIVPSNSIGWGQHGWIKAIRGTEIWLSEPVEFGEDNYSGVLRAVNTEAGVTAEIPVTRTNYSHCVSGTLTDVYTEEDEGHRPSLFVFGTLSTDLYSIRIIKIQPQDEMSVRLNGTIIDPAVYDDPGTAPPYGYDYPEIDLLAWVTITYQGMDGSNHQYYVQWNGSSDEWRFEVWNGASYDIVEDHYVFEADLVETTDIDVQVRVTPYDDGILQSGDAIVTSLNLPDAPASITVYTAYSQEGIDLSWGSVSGADYYELILLKGSDVLFNHNYTTTSVRFYFKDMVAIMVDDSPPWPGIILTAKIRTIIGGYHSAWTETTIDLTTPEPIDYINIYNSTTSNFSFNGKSPGDVDGLGYTVDGFTVLSGPTCHDPAHQWAWTVTDHIIGSDTTFSKQVYYADCYENEFPYSFAVAAYYDNLKSLDYLNFNRRYLISGPGIHHDPDPKIIDKDMTITCAPTGGSADFVGDDALVQALAWLDEYRIPNPYTITIQLADGVYGSGTTIPLIFITHQDCSRIIIQGNNDSATAFNISSATNAPNTSSDYIYVPAGAYSPTDFAPGGSYEDFIVYVVGSTGNDGAYRVTAATTVGSDIRLTMETGTVTDATKDGTLYLKPANKCQLLYNSATTAASGIEHRGCGDLTIRGLSIYNINPSASYVVETGIAVSYNSRTIILSNMIIARFTTGLYALEGAGALYDGTDYADCIVFFGRLGFQTPDGAAVLVTDGAIAELKYACASNFGSGFGTQRSASIDASYSVSSKNDYGYVAAYSSNITCRYCKCMYNVTGCYATIGGDINRGDITNAGNTADYNPAGTPPITGVDGSWIR